MNCRHCQHWNPEDEQRCRLCGRKLQSSENDTTSEWSLNVVAGNLATAPERMRQPAHNGSETFRATADACSRIGPPSKIIPFESRGTASAAAPAAPAPAKLPLTPPKPTRPQAKAAPKSPAVRTNDLQPELDLLPSGADRAAHAQDEGGGEHLLRCHGGHAAAPVAGRRRRLQPDPDRIRDLRVVVLVHGRSSAHEPGSAIWPSAPRSC